MDFSNASRIIREKVKELMEKRGIHKTKLGEILGNKKKEVPQQKYVRAERFLKGKSEVKINALLKLSVFF